MRGQRVLADGSSDKIGRGISDPDYDHGEEEQKRPIASGPMKPDSKRQWKRDQNETAGAHSRSRQRFHKRASCPKRKRGDTEHEEQEHRFQRGKSAGEPPDSLIGD